jgi:hypothetical protein
MLFRRASIFAIVLSAGAMTGCAHQERQMSSTPASSAGSSGPQTLVGSYTFFADGTKMTVNGAPRAGGLPSTTTWRITPCGAGCARVASSLGWTTDLHLTQNMWKATRTLDVDCGRGASTITYTIDAMKLTGTVTNNVPCGSTPSVFVEPATLTKN